ncbi:MAG: hypothetical protein HY744_06030 [Deltaproteobacteria bacterium]|nr:hypothetical protein [Deltaproteobacteria bacterium]
MADRNLELKIGGQELSVRRFSVHEELSEHFRLAILVRVGDTSLDLDKPLGSPASFTIALDRRTCRCRTSSRRC